MGDFNGDLGNSLGGKAKHEHNQRGLKLLDFANYFKLRPVNLMGACHGSTETYFSHCGRYSSTLDYIFLPNSLSEKIVSAKIFGVHVDNISDHVSVQLAIHYIDSIASSKATITRCDLSAAILFKLVESYLIAFKFTQ